MAHIRSSHRLAPERAPRLRRIAELLDLQAPTSRDPAAVRELARTIRLRASDLDCGGQDAEDLAALSDEVAAIAFDTG